MSEPRIQFLFFDGCPLVTRARAALEKALAECRIERYEAIDLLAADTPPDLRPWGSPTILVDGVDVSGEARPEALSCRIYRDPNGVPSANTISSIIRAKTLNREGFDEGASR